MIKERLFRNTKSALLKVCERGASKGGQPVSARFANLSEAVAARLFPSAFSDGEFHERKFALARIFFGLVVAWRYAWVLWSLGAYHAGYLEQVQLYGSIFVCSLVLAIGVLISIGLATRLALAGYACTVMLVDSWLSVQTLGSMIGIFCALMLLLGGAHRRFSLDWYLQRTSRIWRAVFWRGPGDFNVAMAVGFLGMAVLHLLAATLHVGDPAWRSGATLKLLLTTSYLSPHYEVFRMLEEANPSLMTALSAAGGIGQLIWQFAMIPLMLSGWRAARAFVALWGWGFHLASLFFLDLSYLPLIEVLLWSCVFIHPKLWPFAKGSQTTPAEVPGQAISERARPYRVILSTWVLLVVVLSISWSYVTHCPPWLRWRPFDKICRNCNRGLYYVGLAPPNVFNVSDLGLGNKWPVLYRVAPDGDVQQVPLNGTDGERLWYHRSDTIYFGNHARWRRLANKVPSSELAKHEKLKAYINRVVVFDFRRTQAQEDASAPKQIYRVDFYESKMSRFRLPVLERTEAKVVSKYQVDVTQDGLIPTTVWSAPYSVNWD